METILNILTSPNANGILELVVGMLLSITLYHIFIYFQNKDKAYLYYALYTLFIVFGYLSTAENNFLAQIKLPWAFEFKFYEGYFKIIYNSLYFLFALKFIGLKNISKKWYLLIMVPVFLMVIIATIVYPVSFFTGNSNYKRFVFYYIFAPGILIPTLLCYYVLFKFKFTGKYYLIVGSAILFFVSYVGLAIHLIYPKLTDGVQFSIIYSGLIAEIICFALGLGYRQRKEQELRNENEKNYLKQIITSQEDEREKIAKDLHDGVLQQLGSIILKLKNKPNSFTNFPLELEKINSELRHVSHQMMPYGLLQFGLIEALKEVFQNAFSPVDIKYSYHTIGVDDFLPKDISLNLYRVIQELTTNTIKHSSCTEVDIQITQRNGMLVFVMEDNGKGINITADNKGIGLRNIDTRIKHLNGDYRFENGNINGTITTIKIPLS